MERSTSCDQLKRPLIVSEDGSQDVMVVVQCTAGPQLQTLPTATPAAADSIKAFADSITRKSVSGKIVNAYRRLSGSASSPSEVDTRTLKQWRSQTAMMWVWLMSSLMVVVFVPTFVAPGALLLASLTASALGVIAVLMHCMGDRLAESGTFAVSDQIDLAAACATAAGCIDLLAMGMSVAWVWAALNMSSSGLATPEVVPLLMFACNCWQHGVASVAVMQTVGSLEQQDEE